MSSKKFNSKEEIKSIRQENASRDKIALQALIRVSALERALIDSGVLDADKLAQSLLLVTSDVVKGVKKETGMDDEQSN